MLAKVRSFGIIGVEAYPIEVEVDVANGLPAVTLVGLADTAIRESKERVKSAIKNSGFFWPAERITISLAPSDMRKEGASFDLAIALGILAASGQLDAVRLQDYFVLGELSLDGHLRPTKGILPVSMAVTQERSKNLIVPIYNAKEAALVKENAVFGLKTLSETVEFIHNPEGLQRFILNIEDLFRNNCAYPIDFSEVKGQYLAKRAIEVAVSGGHNLAMVGPPGSGKTMLAKRIPTIMPDLTLEESLEITKIHSVAGTLLNHAGLMAVRPFRSPHHSISGVAMIGGGSIPQPGEISLAHQGVLFLDELAEFHRDCLEALRQPLEDRIIRISRILKSLTFPASFMLIASYNPCPCGFYSDPRKTCHCTTTRIQNYKGKISGPLMDRIDIHIEVLAVKYKDLVETKEAEASSIIKERVEKARRAQRARFKQENIFCNAQMNARLIKKYCALGLEAKELLRMAMTELGLSARAYDKILRVSRTIADLGGLEDIQVEHISEAVQYRGLDKQW